MIVSAVKLFRRGMYTTKRQRLLTHDYLFREDFYIDYNATYRGSQSCSKDHTRLA